MKGHKNTYFHKQTRYNITSNGEKMSPFVCKLLKLRITPTYKVLVQKLWKLRPYSKYVHLHSQL